MISLLGTIPFLAWDTPPGLRTEAAPDHLRSSALPPEPKCNVRVVRRSGFADWLRRYDILVNGKYAGSIARNATFDLKVPCGKVTLEARIDWGRSAPLAIEAQPGRRAEVEVTNHWGAWHSLWAITFGAGSYLVLRPTASSST